jgi:hypothetical protein
MCCSPLTGLVFWVIHLLAGSRAAGWAAVGILGGVAGHGLLAGTTFTLVLLTMLTG